MILDHPRADSLRAFRPDACIIGSGPVGICTALDLAARGLRVLVLESGGWRATAEGRALSVAEIVDARTHTPGEQNSARQLGGTANLWGGRCVPFDPIDFRQRPWLDLPDWPIGHADLAPFRDRACALMAAGRPVYTAPPLRPGIGQGFHVDALERWSQAPRLQRLHRRALERAPDILVSLHSTVLGFDYAPDDRIRALDLHLRGEGHVRLEIPLVVLAAGGNASTRLLLAEQSRRPALFGGIGGPLGRHYMGHLSGTVADIAISDPALAEAVDFYLDEHGSYVRRRFVPDEALQAGLGLTNIAFWPVVPRISDPAHRSGPLSAVFLALSYGRLGRLFVAETIRARHVGPAPYRRLPHVGNVLRDLGRTVGFAPRFLWQNQLGRPRLPGLFLENAAARYGLTYHGEHLPDPDSRLTLSPLRDALGMPRLRIDLRFSDRDVALAVRAHEALDAWLRDNRLGALHYYVEPASLGRAIRAQARHGCHQIGTIRMGDDPAQAVVDADCRCFDVPNLYVVGTAVLPTSGQASPTMTAVQLGLRLAARLAGATAAERSLPEPIDAALGHVAARTALGSAVAAGTA
jgi:choline dehydrogenase-like flavoprotein